MILNEFLFDIIFLTFFDLRPVLHKFESIYAEIATDFKWSWMNAGKIHDRLFFPVSEASRIVWRRLSGRRFRPDLRRIPQTPASIALPSPAQYACSSAVGCIWRVLSQSATTHRSSKRSQGSLYMLRLVL